MSYADWNHTQGIIFVGQLHMTLAHSCPRQNGDLCSRDLDFNHMPTIFQIKTESGLAKEVVALENENLV